jgi:hypothetical protein
MGKQTDVKRRNFLLTVGLGGAGAVAAAVGARALAPDARQAGGAAAGAKGYQLTEHVRNYYRTTRV